LPLVAERVRRPRVEGEVVRPRRQELVHVVVMVDGDADLLEVVSTLGAGGGFANLLHRRHQQADQDRDDRDHDEQLDQGEARAGEPRAGKPRSRAVERNTHDGLLKKDDEDVKPGRRTDWQSVPARPEDGSKSVPRRVDSSLWQMKWLKFVL